jgi:alanine racemase
MVGPDVKIALVAKADAYGHGLIPVSRYAVRNGADWIAVATVQEGIALRDAGLDTPVLALSPLLEIEAEQAVFYNLDIVVERASTAEALGRAAVSGGRTARVHLKVDTGLSRFGASVEEAASIAAAIKSVPGVALVGVSQHFSNSYSDPDATRTQAERFERALAECRAAGIEFELVHMANSAATAVHPAMHRNLVRVGMLAYGFGPASVAAGCEPVMAWMARVTAMRTVPAGTPLSYGGSYVTPRESRIATVGVGYGDGYPRSASNRAHVAIGGRRAPVVGTVCMDQILVDVTDLPEVGLSDTVTVIGPGASAYELAEAAGTIAHEVVCRLMSRVPRRYDFGQ